MPRVEWSFLLAAEDHKEIKKLTALTLSRVTPWGQAILAAGMFSLGISSVGTQIAAYLLPSFIVALFITAAILVPFFKPKVEAHRILTPTTAGGRFVYRVVVRNTGKKIIRNLSVFEQSLPYGIYADYNHPEYNNFIDWLEPGEQASCTLVFRTPRRGIFELPPLLACSAFPSGVIRSVRKVGGRTKFVVYPKLIQPDDMPVGLQRMYQRGGISESNKVGDSNEFASTREYRHGDRLRDIHWASTARTGRLIVKEYVEEYFVRIGFYIDEELRRFEKHRCFEARLSLCAGMCRDLNRRDYIIDIFLGSRARHIQSGRGLNGFPQILEFLAGIDGEPKVNFDQSMNNLKEYSRELSELVVLLRDWDSTRSLFVQRLRETGLHVKPVIVRDGKTTLPVDDPAVITYTSKELLKNG